MLGRTDSRTRALLLLVAFVVVAGSLGVRLAYWQVARRDELAAMAVKQSSMRYEIPSRRGSIYDRTGTVVLATSVNRDRLAANPKLLSPERRAQVAAKLVELLGLEGDDAANLTARMTSEREYVILARDLDPTVSDRIRELSGGDQPELSGLILEPQAVREYPQQGGGPRTTLAAHLLGFVNREGDRPVRRRAVLPGRPRRPPDRRRRPARRVGQRHPGVVDGHREGLSRAGPDAHDRRLAPGLGRAGAPVRLDRRPREARVRGGDGPLHRRGVRVRELPVVRRERLPGDREHGPGPVHRPDRVHGLRARARCSRCSPRRPPSAPGS